MPLLRLGAGALTEGDGADRGAGALYEGDAGAEGVARTDGATGIDTEGEAARGGSDRTVNEDELGTLRGLDVAGAAGRVTGCGLGGLEMLGWGVRGASARVAGRSIRVELADRDVELGTDWVPERGVELGVIVVDDEDGEDLVGRTG